MNNTDLRTLADRVINGGSTDSNEAVLLAEGVKRLLDENVRLSGLLADEILDGSVEVPLADVTIRAADLPDGFQEVDLDDGIV